MFTVLAGISAALFGLCALIMKFKHENGQFNRNSIPLMAGIGSAAMLSVFGAMLGNFESAFHQYAQQAELFDAIENRRRVVRSDDIKIVVTYSHSTGSGIEVTLFENSYLAITVAETLEPAALKYRRLADQLPDRAIGLSSSWSESTKHAHTTVDDVQWTQKTLFSQFEGALEQYADFAEWNGADINMVLSSEFNDDLREWGRNTRAHFGRPDDRRARQLYAAEYEIAGKDDDYSIGPLNCTATLRLLIRDIEVGEVSSVPVSVRAWDEDVRGAIYIRWPTIACKDDLYVPVDSGQPPTALSHWITVLAWGCVSAIALAALWLVVRWARTLFSA